MAKIYFIISEKPDGELAHFRCSSMVLTPQEAADQYTKNGRYTPKAWVHMEWGDFDKDCREEYLEDALAAGQAITRVNGKWVAGVGLAKPNPADLMGYPAPITPGPRKPAPVICPEVWNTKPYDADDVMAAVRASAKGA